MKIVILFCLFVSLLDIIPEKIVIDVTRCDNLKVSEIAEEVIAIPLKTNEFTFHSIDKVYLINENLFIWDIYKEEGILYSYVSIFDLSGNYKGQLSAKDPVSKEDMVIVDMKCDESNKTIYLVFSDGIRVYDSNGKFLTFYKGLIKLYPGIVQWGKVFHGQIWFRDLTIFDGVAEYGLAHSDLNGQGKATIKFLKDKLPEEQVKSGVVMSYKAVLSIHNNELYVSFGIDNTIYKVSQDKLSPVYKFEFRNRSASNYKAVDAPNQTIIGAFIKNEYWIKGIAYDFLYNTKTGSSFNIKYLHDKNGELSSGIKDDYFNTGFFTINPTNIGNCIYFIKNPANINGSKLFDPNQTSPILILVKLK